MDFYKEDGHTSIPHDQLPRLVILTGLNGSGKTRGLKQLQEADPHGTQYIDYRNFSARWDSSTYASSNPYGEIVLQDIINDWKFPRPVGPMALHPLFGVSDNESLVAWIKRSPTSCNFSRIAWIFFEIFPEANDSAFEEHADLLSNFPDRAEIYWNQFEKDPVPAAYKDASIRTKLPVHHLSEQDVIQSLDRLQRLKHPLQFDLAAMVSEYVEKRNKFFYESCVNKNFDDQPSVDAFRQKYPNPFDHINAELKRLADDETGVFQFEVQSNVPEMPSTYEQLKQLPPSIEIKLRDTKTGELREFGELSSGEQTLLALATLIYTHKYIQPMRALYLDEIDASLHPTMIKSMLKILQEQSGDTRIYLATHSPSTVALAPEEALFFVKEKSKAIKIDRTEALEGLTQGYFTTEGIAAVLRILNGVDKNIIVISEGKNDNYLVSILKRLGYDDRIYVHQWANPGGKGTDNLKPLMALFGEIITSGPRKFVFLFDCDADPRDFIKSTDHVIGVFLPKLKPENHPVQRGIENIIPKSTLSTLEKKFGSEVYKKKNGESAINDNYKDAVAEFFLSELIEGHIDLALMRTVLKDLLGLCPQQ